MTKKAAGLRSRVAIVGVPMDLGSNLRGVDMGPSAIRIAGVVEQLRQLGCNIKDFGNITVPHAATVSTGSSKIRFADVIHDTCETLAETVEGILDSGFTPVILGGDHSIAMGSLAGLARFGRNPKRKKAREYGLLWVDAHADSNTVGTTPSGNIHGMPLAVALGLGEKRFTHLGGQPPMIEAKNAALLAARKIDREERDNLGKLGLRVMTMREIDERGVTECMNEALKVATGGTDGFHLSFDIDCIDPSVAPGVGTPVAGGLTLREAHLIMEMVSDSREMVSCELVEVNPVIDEGNKTAELAAWLIRSALGGRIL